MTTFAILSTETVSNMKANFDKSCKIRGFIYRIIELEPILMLLLIRVRNIKGLVTSESVNIGWWFYLVLMLPSHISIGWWLQSIILGKESLKAWLIQNQLLKSSLVLFDGKNQYQMALRGV